MEKLWARFRSWWVFPALAVAYLLLLALALADIAQGWSLVGLKLAFLMFVLASAYNRRVRQRIAAVRGRRRDRELQRARTEYLWLFGPIMGVTAVALLVLVVIKV